MTGASSSLTSTLSTILVISNVFWVSQHILTVVARDYFIAACSDHEEYYSMARFALNVSWYIGNVILHLFIFYNTPILYKGIPRPITQTIRLVSLCFLILCLFVTPSAFDIAVQRANGRNGRYHPVKSNSKNLNAGFEVGSDAQDRQHVPVIGLSHITRHPMLWAVAFFFLSFLLTDVRLADLYYFVPQLALIVVGVSHQEYRMKNDPSGIYIDYMEATSVIPFVSLIRKKTVMSGAEAKRIFIVLFAEGCALGIFGVVSLFTWIPWISDISTPLGGVLTSLYIVILVVVDIVAIQTGKYYRVT